MHIVLITHYYPPEVNAPAQRAYNHAKIWLEMGHQVTIVTAAPSHPYGVVYDGFKNETNVNTVDGVRLIRLKTQLGANTGIAKRAWNYVSFMFAVWSNRKLIDAGDVVISTSPQFFAGVAGYFVAKYRRVPWVLEIRDIWPESIIAVGAAKASPATRALQAIADWAYRTSDMIISVSQGFQSHFRERGIADEKVRLITNGIDAGLKPAPASFDEFPELETLKGRFIGAYIGTLGMASGLLSVLDAAEKLKADGNDNVGILLVGSGALRDQLLEEIDKRGLDNLVLLGQQPRDRIEKLYSLISANIVHLKKQDVFKTVIPTKLLEAMAMGKPILLGVEGTAAEILNAGKSGVAVEPENAGAIADGLSKLANDPAFAESCSESGKEYVRREFDRRVLAQRYVELLEELVAEKSR